MARAYNDGWIYLGAYFNQITFRYQHDLVEICAKINPAVVVSTCHSGTASEWQLLRWAKRRGIKRVAWQCGYEYNPTVLKSLILRRFVPLFDFHLCYHSNAQDYAMTYGAGLDQTLVMHNTIDESKIVAGQVSRARSELSEMWPSLDGKSIVLYVGAVLEEKRLDRVFAALDAMGDDSIMFVLVGDGPYLSTLKERYKDRQNWLAAGRVVEGVAAYFDAADVFVLPGTCGLAINEAMAHRLPVISGYADGSADDLVVDGITGFRLQQNSAAELADRLNDVLSDPERAAAMGQQGEQRIRGHLSFKSFIDRVVNVLVDQHVKASQGV